MLPSYQVSEKEAVAVWHNATQPRSPKMWQWTDFNLAYSEWVALRDSYLEKAYAWMKLHRRKAAAILRAMDQEL